MDFQTTKDIKIPKLLIDQVIGQDYAKELVKIAAKQKRSLLLVGPPGIGKSMLAKAMAELLPTKNELEDILVYPNPTMENEPLIRTVKSFPDFNYIVMHGFQRYYTPAELHRIRLYTQEGRFDELPALLGKSLGRRIYERENEIRAPKLIQQPKGSRFQDLALSLLLGGLTGYILFGASGNLIGFGITSLALTLIFYIWIIPVLRRMGSVGRIPINQNTAPKLIVDNSYRTTAPFIDATGTRGGALLGDVKHDPFQTGGLGTPAHLRVEAGAIHKAHKGILYIDEIGTMPLDLQQKILTAMQEKKFSITGQSENSAGALVKTKPVPTDFVLVASGNPEDIKGIHPALRSRIRGSGYEIYMDTEMPDTPENRYKLAVFVAQEVEKDKKIPHFTKEAVEEIIKIAREMADRKGYLTLRLRELGGIVRAAGDLALKEGAQFVEKDHVRRAKETAFSAEQQYIMKQIEKSKEYRLHKTEGYEIGRVNGLAVYENQGIVLKGIVMPIEASVTPALNPNSPQVYATGGLREIAKEAVQNVMAIIKKAFGKNLAKKDVHIQFVQSYNVEGDSASIAIAVATISALFGIPVRQDIAMTGSLDIQGKVLAVGGVNKKIEAAKDLGLRGVIIPKVLMKDVMVKGIEIYPVETLDEVLEISLKDSPEKDKIVSKIRDVIFSQAPQAYPQPASQ